MHSPMETRSTRERVRVREQRPPQSRSAQLRTLWQRIQLTPVLGTIIQTISLFTSRQGGTYAAAIAYYALFSLIPLLFALVTVVSIVLRDVNAQARVLTFLYTQLPATSQIRDTLAHLVESLATRQGGVAGIISLVLAAWSASQAVGALRQGLNAFFGPGTPRFALLVRLRDTLLVMVSGILLVLSTVATAGLVILRHLMQWLGIGPLVPVFSSLVALALSFLLFLAVFRIIPSQPPALRHAWPGALLSAVGFELLKLGFGFYISRIQHVEAISGTLGSAVIFLVFGYLSATLMLLGAAFIVVQRTRRSAKSSNT
ncbi:MAG: YihY/virulence factor BrkB family protein [Thermorudis peleae]|nr:YihY/virulence factor BrkB family protein [Thermorudis peleae]